MGNSYWKKSNLIAVTNQNVGKHKKVSSSYVLLGKKLISAVLHSFCCFAPFCSAAMTSFSKTLHSTGQRSHLDKLISWTLLLKKCFLIFELGECVERLKSKWSHGSFEFPSWVEVFWFCVGESIVIKFVTSIWLKSTPLPLSPWQ